MRSCTEGAFASCATAAFPFPPWRSVHRSLVVLACSPTGMLRGFRAHTRRRTLSLLHGSLLDELLCLAAQIKARKRQWLGHGLE